MKVSKSFLLNLKLSRMITGAVLIFLLVFLLGGRVLANGYLLPVMVSGMENAAGLLTRFLSFYLVSLVSLFLLGILAIIITDLLMVVFYSSLMPYLGFKKTAVLTPAAGEPFYGCSAVGGPLLRIVAFSGGDLSVFSREVLVSRESYHPLGGWVTSLIFWLNAFTANTATLLVAVDYFQADPDFMNLLPLVVGLYLFFFLMLLSGMRWGELVADYKTFKKYGSRAWGGVKEALVKYFETDDPSEVPLGARYLHTGQRELVLRDGDVLAPLSSLEIVFPMGSLLAGMVAAYILQFMEIMDVPFILIFFLVAWVVAVMLVYFLGVIFDAIMEIVALGSSLTGKGVFNLSVFLTAFMGVFSFLGLLLSEVLYLYTFPLLACLAGFLVSWYAFRSWWRSLLACLTVVGGLALLLYLILEFDKLFRWMIYDYLL